jgi:hypothetical protein
MQERREISRVPVKKQCVLTIEGRQVKARLEDVSRKGGLLRILEPGDTVVTNDDLGTEATFVLATEKGSTNFTGEIIRLYYADGAYHVVVRFWKESPESPV